MDLEGLQRPLCEPYYVLVSPQQSVIQFHWRAELCADLDVNRAIDYCNHELQQRATVRAMCNVRTQYRRTSDPHKEAVSTSSDAPGHRY